MFGDNTWGAEGTSSLGSINKPGFPQTGIFQRLTSQKSNENWR